MPHGWAPFEESESKKDDIFDLTAMGPGGAGGYLEKPTRGDNQSQNP